MHDSAACLVRDGRIVAAVAEERLSRVKHDSAFPARAILECLRLACVGPDELDFISFAWSKPYRSYLHDLRNIATGRYPLARRSAVDSTLHFVHMWHQAGGAARLRSLLGPLRARMGYVDHHLSHAISAYVGSGFQDAAVV